MSKVIFVEKIDDTAYAAMKTKMEQAKVSEGEKFLFMTDRMYYSRREDWNNYAKTALAFADQLSKEDHNALNEMAYTFYEHIDDKAHLEKALQWATLALKLQEKASYTDTYAALLFKLGRKKEAITAEEKAIALAKAAGEDTTDYEKMLEKIKK